MKQLLLMSVVAACAVVASPYGAGSVATASLTVPGRASGTPSLASGGGLIVAAWSASLPGGETDLFAAVSRDGGVSFPATVRVNHLPGDVRVNGEQPPRVTVVPRVSAAPLITVVWTSKHEHGTTILYARSEDGGRTYGRAAAIPEGAAAGNRGWQNAAVDAAGVTRVVWLDHREMASAGGSGHVHGANAAPSRDADTHDGVAMAQKSKLYVATTGEAGVARIVTAGVCYCCKTAIVSGPDNDVYLAWRHVFPGNLRDIAFAVSRDGGRTFSAPRKVSEDRWQLQGCPDDGPAMTIDRSKRLHVAWPTLVADGQEGSPSIGIFYARSIDGVAFGPRERLATEGLPHHPQVLVNGGRVFVAWDELKDGRRRIVIASRTLEGQASFTRAVVGEWPGLQYPSLAPAGAGVLMAWTAAADQSRIQLARVQ